MALAEKLFLFLLTIPLSASLWPGNPVWYDELKEKCVGAEDEYYVDKYFRRCCKCSNCIGSRHRRIVDCSLHRNCEADDIDCVSDDYFGGIFNKSLSALPSQHPMVSPQPTTTTKLPMSASSLARETVSSVTKVSETPTPDSRDPTQGPGPPASGISLILVGVTAAAIVALLFVLAFLLRSKCGKTGSSSLEKLMHICKREKPSSSGSAGDRESNRDEVTQLVSESGNEVNEAPPPRISPDLSPPSEFGPPEMMRNELHEITCRNAVSRDRSFADSSISTNDRISDIGGPLATRNGFQTERLDHQSNNSGTVISGNNNFILATTNGGGNVSFDHANITIVYPGATATNIPPQISVGSGLMLPRQSRGENSSRDGLPSSASESAGDGCVRLNPCFASQNTGVCVTGASAPLPKKREDNFPIRRQSSQISSTSNGPVENSYGGNSYPKEISVSQESNSPTCQRHSSSSIPSSQMSSRLHGPVQHSSRNRESLHHDSSNGCQYSREDCMITGVTRSPQADLESS